MKHKGITILAVAAVAVAAYLGYSRNADTISTEPQIETAQVQRGDIKVMVSGSGQVFAASQVDLKPVVAGEGIDIKQVYVKNDQTVEKGDLIALLDDSEAQKRVRDSRLEVAAAELKQKQTNKEFPTQTVADKRNRQAQEIVVAQRRNDLADAIEALEDYTIRAPFDGVLTGLEVEAGDSISREDVLATIITEQMYAEVSLNEVDAAKVSQGNAATLTFDAISDLSVPGSVAKIDTIGTAEQGVVSYNAEIAFNANETHLKPGMSVSAEIEVEAKQNVLMVPSSAVRSENGVSYVEVVDGQPAAGQTGGTDQASTANIRRQSIKTGISNDVYTEIVSGLQERQRVITQTIEAAADTTQQNRSIIDSFRPGGQQRSTGGSGGGGNRVNIRAF